MAVFLASLKNRGYLDRIHMTICNVGSRKLNFEDDYGNLGWNIFAPNLTIYGFDADADACEAANATVQDQQVNWTEKHIPLAFSDQIGESTLYVTRWPACSSLYPPNEPYLSRFAGLLDLVATELTIDLATTTLDAFCQEEGIETVDFLQIDVQGADLNVLQGATRILPTVLAIQTEVEFSHLYQGQPLFADVDAFLRARDFTLFDLTRSTTIRSHSPIHTVLHPGQLLWADAFYFCDLLQAADMTHAKTPEQILKLACVADVMEFSDYALEILKYLTVQYGSDPAYNFADAIVESLRQFPQVVEQWSTYPLAEILQPYLSSEMAKTLHS